MANDLRRRNKEQKTKTLDAGKEKDDNLKDLPAEQKPNHNLSLKILSRVVVISSLLIIVYFSSKEENFKPLAKQDETLSGKAQVVRCSQEYLSEVDKYEGCFPRECKRIVSDTVVSQKEAEILLALAKKGLQFGGSSGGASILDLHSGALSKGEQFVNIYKHKDFPNLITEDDFNTYRSVKNKIKYFIADHFGTRANKIYLTHPTFFSEITSKNAVTVHDEYWHPHVDKETYKSFHYTSLLYLSDYEKDFKGGRFVFIDGRVNSTVEPKKGRVSIFTSGQENLHYVEKVTSGVRYAVTISFTCDTQYAIQDPLIPN